MKRKNAEMLKVRGFVRMNLVDAKTGKILGDSGFVENTVVNLGFQDYIVGALGKIAGSKQAEYMAIGTGTAPAADATVLAGETGVRVTSSNSCVSSKTLQATCQFAGSDMGGTCTIQNVALANLSSGGTILAGTTCLKAWVEWVAILIKKFRKVGGTLYRGIKTIPRQALRKFKEAVTTRDGTPEMDESIVCSLWRHKEIARTRNELSLAA